eukprot:6203395-Pleurochrysis_carterae.AAC.5
MKAAMLDRFVDAVRQTQSIILKRHASNPSIPALGIAISKRTTRRLKQLDGEACLRRCFHETSRPASLMLSHEGTDADASLDTLAGNVDARVQFHCMSREACMAKGQTVAGADMT